MSAASRIVALTLIFASSLATAKERAARTQELVDVVKLVNGSLRTVRERIPAGGSCRLDGKLYESVATANAALVQRCHEKAAAGAAVRVRRELKELCLRPALYRHAYPNFQLSNEKDGIHLGYELRLRMDGLDADERAEALSQIKACTQRIRGFWSRYGIKFDLGVATADGPSSLDAPSHELKLTDDVCRSEEGAICLGGRTPGAPRCEEGCRSETTRARCLAGCKEARWNVACLTLLHESGHHLGLPDEYEDAVCTDRTTISEDSDPWSVMDDQGAGWEHIEFFPRHLAAILGDLCP